jgi:hypothetical protein
VCVNPDQPEVMFNLDWATTEGSGCFLGLLLFSYNRSSTFFLLVIINYKYNNLLNITLIFIITVKLLKNIYHR